VFLNIKEIVTYNNPVSLRGLNVFRRVNYVYGLNICLESNLMDSDSENFGRYIEKY